MGLALDEPGPEDKTIDRNGVIFLLDEQIHRWLQYGEQVTIDYNEQWQRFRVQLAGAGSC